MLSRDPSVVPESYEPGTGPARYSSLADAADAIAGMSEADLRVLVVCSLAGVSVDHRHGLGSEVAEALGLHRGTVSRSLETVRRLGLLDVAPNVAQPGPIVAQEVADARRSADCCVPFGFVLVPEIMVKSLTLAIDTLCQRNVAQHVAQVAPIVAQPAGNVAPSVALSGVRGGAAPVGEGGEGGVGALDGAQGEDQGSMGNNGEQTKAPGSSSNSITPSGRRKKNVAQPGANVAQVGLADIVVPAPFDTELGRAAITRWLEYKRARRQAYKNAKFLSEMLAAIVASEPGANDADLDASVSVSAGNGYQGLVFKRYGGSTNGSKPTSGAGVPRGSNGSGAQTRVRNGAGYGAAAAARTVRAGAQS